MKAVVSYDNLGGVPKGDAANSIHAPALYFSTDYDFPQPVATPMRPDAPPDPERRLTSFKLFRDAGVDVMSITPRASGHEDYSFHPYPAAASRYGERVAFYYSLAWFDRYVKGDWTALARLRARIFDDSSDRHSIGAGTFDADRAAASPADPGAGNVPYAIAGKCVANLLSFYYRSASHLRGARDELDLRSRGCH